MRQETNIGILLSVKEPRSFVSSSLPLLESSNTPTDAQETTSMAGSLIRSNLLIKKKLSENKSCYAL